METMCLGFITNPTREELTQSVCDALAYARARGFTCVVDAALHEKTGIDSFAQRKPDILFAYGGDGTILRAAPTAIALDVPLCGVNLGRIGFLSEADADQLGNLLTAISAGSYKVEERMLLNCRVNDKVSYLCANDALLYRKSFSGVVSIRVAVDGMDAGNVFCDGLIVCTPTGSTGYSISAGGPVIAPGVDVAVITPICPHSLTFRPIIASADAKIELRAGETAHLAIDGTETTDVEPEDTICLCRAKETLKFIRVLPHNLYALIRDKLS